MTDLNKLLNKIVLEKFSELKSEDIQIEYTDLKDALLYYGLLSSEGYYIEVDKSLRTAPSEVLAGGIAHECAHLITEQSFGKKLFSPDALAYKLSARYRVLDERNADLEVVLRGLGRQLLTFLEYAEKCGYPHYRTDGLSIREIRKLLHL